MHLDILDVTIHVEVPDARWERFLRILWEPLLVQDRNDEELRFHIRARGSGWALQHQGRDLGISTDPWLIADGLRHVVVETALPLARRVLALHAAALTRDDTVLLIAGASAAGKTTLSLALVDQCWRLMSDDVAPIDRSTGEVLPLPKPLGIKDLASWDTSDLVGIDEGWPGPPRGAFLVPAPRVQPSPARPTHLLFATFAPDAEASLVEVGPARTVVLLGPLVRDVDPGIVTELAALAETLEAAQARYASTAAALDLLGTWLPGNDQMH